MSHMIDESNSRANIAYVGAKPWHGLGQALTAGADLETWRREAGLDWTVKEAPVQYQNGELRTWDARKVLFRSDNGAALSVMAKGYNVVQPADVLNLYSEIAKAGGFTLETAGSLDEGRRIWALAKVHDGAAWFDRHGSVEQCRFLIHEFCHTVEGDHLSARYHDALCKMGARLVRLAVERPEVFR